MNFDYVVRPHDDRTWIQPSTETSRFTASFADTLDLLGHEVGMLAARGSDRPVVMIDVVESDLRLDGRLRANARPASEAVALAFESRTGPLVFRCCRYRTTYYSQGPAWQHNLRAIALTLEALRAVNRYGATAHGEQYRGFRAITAAKQMDDAVAIETLTRTAGLVPAAWTPERIAEIVRRARRNSHPDHWSGSRAQWDLVEEALQRLGLNVNGRKEIR